MDEFLQQKGNFRELRAYQKAECIYDVTFYFAHKYLDRGDRTIDQMVQAARSGKQNIAEGCAAGTTSSETEIRLINVARASFQELLVDYEDYLRVRGLEQWAMDDPRCVQARHAAARHNDSAFYRQAIAIRNHETIANIAITLLHQVDFLLKEFLKRLQHDFVAHGGIREQMTRARLAHRNGRRQQPPTPPAQQPPTPPSPGTPPPSPGTPPLSQQPPTPPQEPPQGT